MLLTLRARIMLVLVLIGLVPLLFAVIINLPLVLEQVGSFYRHAFLQDLRADFRDLDEHLASRYETVRLLAKLPEPGAVMGTESDTDQDAIDLERARYTDWINRILSEQLDVIHISFLDEQGVSRFWLEREPVTRTWSPTANRPPYPRPDLLKAVQGNPRIGVLPTPVRVDPDAKNPAWVLTLQLLSPIVAEESTEAIGVVSVTIDIGGLARRDPSTLWVHDDGSYLTAPGLPRRIGNAFENFAGLRERFAAGQIALWDGGDEVVVWVPLLRTSDDRPLWVARTVDRKPLENFKNALMLRVLGVVLLLVVSTLLVARWFANRTERFGSELLDGIRRMLQRDEAVTFSWGGSSETKQLGEDLSKLAETHARNSRNLRAHARELEQSNRFKSEFLANVSHELRTPLNSILLLSKLLSENGASTPEERRQSARVIHEASKDLRALIDNILDLSRIEAGRLELHVEQVDLHQLIEDVVALLRPQFDVRNLYLKVVLSESADRHIRTDPDKVRQVLKNFLANAVKFTESGGVEVTLESAPHPYCVRITVADTGVGIAADKHQAIFEAFKQADGSTRRRYGGTGLGLTISRNLAQLLGGEIQLKSDPGEGAAFAILLPTDCAVEPREESETIIGGDHHEDESRESATPQATFAAQRILVIEPNMRRLLELTPVLEGWGLSVLAAGDPEEARDALEDERVDLVLVGPDRSHSEGYATITSMRQDSRLNHAAVIALLDTGDSDAYAAVRSAGADDALQLPLDWGVLSELLRRHLKLEDPVA